MTKFLVAKTDCQSAQNIFLLFLVFLQIPTKLSQPQNHVPIPVVNSTAQSQTAQSPRVELVDQIESIEVSATQLVIITTKQGPPDTAKVAIKVVDIETGEELPAMNLTGILLILTRGRYTISFLKPRRWYGVSFRCEQSYSGGTAVYVNEEEHLVKTHGDDGPQAEIQPLVSVNAKRFGEKGRSLENLVVIARWEQHPDERPVLDAWVNITLFCHEQIKYKQLKLYGREVDKAVEVRLDNDFEVHEQYNGSSRQMVASIRPKNCPRICWNAELVGEVGRHQFRRAATRNCQEIEPIIATTPLRDYVGYETIGDRLVVHTNFSQVEDAEEYESDATDEKDAYVQLTAIAVPESKKNNSTVRFKTTDDHGDDYIIENLEPNQLYAVQYTYGKQSPFVYEESRRFVVDTSPGTGGDVRPKDPVHIVMDYLPLPSTTTRRPTTTTKPPDSNATSRNDTSQPSDDILPKREPRTTILLDPQFRQYEVGVDFEPLCDERRDKGAHVWLSRDKPSRELRLDPSVIADAICDVAPTHSVCPRPEEDSVITTNGTTRATTLRQKQAACPLGSELCYTANLLVHEKIYSMKRKCVEVANALPTLAPPTTTATTRRPTPKTSPKPTGSGATGQFAKRIGYTAHFICGFGLAFLNVKYLLY